MNAILHPITKMRTVLCLLLPLLMLRPGIATGEQSPMNAERDPFPVRESAYEMKMRLDFEREHLTADVVVTVRNHRNAPVARVPFLLYRLLTVRGVEGQDGVALDFTQDVVADPSNPRRHLNQVRVSLSEPLSPGEETEVRIHYDGWLAGYVETGTLYIRDRIDEDFTIIRTDAYSYPQVGEAGARWEELPSFDYDAHIDVPTGHVVANGGQLLHRVTEGDREVWRYQSTAPAWRMDFAVARYGLLEDRDLRVFHLPGDSVGGARVMDAVRRSRELFTEWFGPLHDPPRLAIIEIPDGWGSQKDETAILQTAAAFRDPARIYEVYHEVSHFWNVPSTERPSARVEEGLASYLEDLAVEELDGRPRLAANAERLETWVRDAFADNDHYRSTPMADYGAEDLAGLSYGVGQLMFYALESILGRETLLKQLGAFYQDCAGTGSDLEGMARFLDERTAVSLSDFFGDWIFSTGWYEFIAAGGTTPEYAEEYRTSHDRTEN